MHSHGYTWKAKGSEQASDLIQFEAVTNQAGVFSLSDEARTWPMRDPNGARTRPMRGPLEIYTTSRREQIEFFYTYNTLSLVAPPLSTYYKFTMGPVWASYGPCTGLVRAPGGPRKNAKPWKPCAILYSPKPGKELEPRVHTCFDRVTHREEQRKVTWHAACTHCV